MTRRFFSLLIASVDILASRAKKAAKSRRPAAGIAAGCPGSPVCAKILLRTARSRHEGSHHAFWKQQSHAHHSRLGTARRGPRAATML